MLKLKFRKFYPLRNNSDKYLDPSVCICQRDETKRIKCRMYVRNSRSLGWNLFSRQVHPLFYPRARERFSFHVPSLNGKRSQIYFRAYDKPSKRTMYFRVKESHRYLTSSSAFSVLAFVLHMTNEFFSYGQLTESGIFAKSEILLRLENTNESNILKSFWEF